MEEIRRKDYDRGGRISHHRDTEQEVKTPVPFHRIGSPGSLALARCVSAERMLMLLHNFFSVIYARFCSFFFFFSCSVRSPSASASSALFYSSNDTVVFVLTLNPLILLARQVRSIK